MKPCCKKKQKRLFSMPTRDRSRSHWLRLAWIARRRFNLDMKKYYPVLSIVKHLNKLPGKTWTFCCWKFSKPDWITNHLWKQFTQWCRWFGGWTKWSPETSSSPIYSVILTMLGRRAIMIKPVRNSKPSCYNLRIKKKNPNLSVVSDPGAYSPSPSTSTLKWMPKK